MNGIHDLGGMHGFGPIEIERDEPLFHAPWEARVLGIMETTLYELELYNEDALRHGIEQMAPADYLHASYFARWLASIEYNLVQADVVSSAEIDARLRTLQGHPDTPPPENATDPRRTPPPVDHSPYVMPSPTPRFAAGNQVVTRNIHPQHHTRLPRYARGKQGVITMVHGPTPRPDARVHGFGDHPDTVYNVRFTAQELWGEAADPRQTISLDLFDSYLEPTVS